MKLIRNAAISAACMLALAAGAIAQQQQQQQEPEPQQQPQQPEEKGVDDEREPVAGKATLGVSVEETQILVSGWRASKLIGSIVNDDENKKIGKIDDLIIAPDGKLSAAVIDVGGFVGVASHRVAIPIGQFRKLGAGKAVLSGATKDELKKLPEFKYTQ